MQRDECSARQYNYGCTKYQLYLMASLAEAGLNSNLQVLDRPGKTRVFARSLTRFCSLRIGLLANLKAFTHNSLTKG